MTIRTTTSSIDVDDTEAVYVTRGVTWAIKVARCEGVPSICVCTLHADGYWQEDDCLAAVLVQTLDHQSIFDIRAWRDGVLVPAVQQWLAVRFDAAAPLQVVGRYALADEVVRGIRIEERPDGALLVR